MTSPQLWAHDSANVSRPIQNQSSGDFQADLGRAGDAHPDTHDQLGSFTALVVATDTPKHCTTANFHLIELGVFIPMNVGTTIIFSGLRLHARAPSMAQASLTEIPQSYYSLALILYLTKELASPQDVRSQLCSSLADKKHSDVLVLPPEAYTTTETYRALPATFPVTMLRDGHMVAGDRLPAYTMGALAALLNHLTRESPEYLYRFTAAGLANGAEVKRISDDANIDVSTQELDPTRRSKIISDWDDLLKLQRYYLGGVSTAKQKMPSREPTAIKLKHVPIYPDKLSKLRGARALPLDEDHTPEASTSARQLTPENDTESDLSLDTDLSSPSEIQSTNSLGKCSRISDEEEDPESSEDFDVNQDQPSDREDSPSVEESEEHNEAEENAKKKQKRSKKVYPKAIKKTKKNKLTPSKNKDSTTKRPVEKKDMRVRLLGVLNTDYLMQTTERLMTQLHRNPNSKATWYCGRPVHNTSISMNIIDFSCQDATTLVNLNQALHIPAIVLNILKGLTNLQGLELNKLLIRYSVMLGVWRLWGLIEVDFRRLVQHTLDGTDNNWLSPLVIKICDHYINRNKDILILKSADYLPGVAKDVTFRLPPATRRWLNNEVSQIVINSALDALGTWLECPRNVGKTALWRDQGFLIEILISHTGSNNICFLDETWEAFQNPKLLIGAKQNGAGTTD
ncbi:hypothetical protein OE88DRAFT_1643257 [Heliocybe sulcata]|uniref:Uncharacterized protein n=1 Tax=Heliocybe sulcata TaxID=5364 RepID=A0A5C3NIU5_9AGAM|nr:hypothetical protein OE88DRAFT_1643257 [Heliocybe sulcata]